MMLECLRLLYVFFKIGIVGFGGGYAMLSMIMNESLQFSVTPMQLADLNALDMVVPGPIAINSATYVGYLHLGIPGAVAATIGVSLPSFILAALVLRFFRKFQDRDWLGDTLSGIKPAAVGLIVYAALTIATNVVVWEGLGPADLFSDPLKAISWICVAIFAATAVLNIRFKINPILLTILAGILGAIVSA